MADDREVLREVWEGRIPVAFHLAKDEVASEQPDPFYVSMIAVTPKKKKKKKKKSVFTLTRLTATSERLQTFLFTFFFFFSTILKIFSPSRY